MFSKSVGPCWFPELQTIKRPIKLIISLEVDFIEQMYPLALVGGPLSFLRLSVIGETKINVNKSATNLHQLFKVK